MLDTAHSELSRFIDTVLPISNVLEQTASFLEKCGWALEIDDELIEMPKDIELSVRSRAFIKANLEDVFMGDHLEAVVLLGREVAGEHVRAEYGVLRMYFNLEGQFVSEDRYNEYA
jgi:hypothetical protein